MKIAREDVNVEKGDDRMKREQRQGADKKKTGKQEKVQVLL